MEFGFNQPIPKLHATPRHTKIAAVAEVDFPVFSERELTFTFAICYRPLVCLSSVTLVRPTQAVQIFGNISKALGTLAIL